MLEVNKINKVSVNCVMCNQETKSRNEAVRLHHELFQNAMWEIKRMAEDSIKWGPSFGNSDEQDPFKSSFLHLPITVLFLADSRPNLPDYERKTEPEYVQLSFSVTKYCSTL